MNRTAIACTALFAAAGLATASPFIEVSSEQEVTMVNYEAEMTWPMGWGILTTNFTVATDAGQETYKALGMYSVANPDPGGFHGLTAEDRARITQDFEKEGLVRGQTYRLAFKQPLSNFLGITNTPKEAVTLKPLAL